MTRDEKKYEVKVAILRSLAEAGEGPDVLVKPAAFGLEGASEVAKDALGAIGAVTKQVAFPLAVGIPAVLAYNMQRMRDTAKSDMRASLDVETVAAYRRAAAEAEALRKARKGRMAPAEQQEPAGLPW